MCKPIYNFAHKLFKAPLASAEYGHHEQEGKKPSHVLDSQQMDQAREDSAQLAQGQQGKAQDASQDSGQPGYLVA